MRRLFPLLCTLLIAAACSAPPQKEIDRAQGAIDAARAAGAEQYAAESFKAATSMLQQAHDAVAQRDYRLALSLAIEANDSALTAAKEAADGKARARGEAERATALMEAALKELQAHLAEAQAARMPARSLTGANTAASNAAATLQEARTALGAGDFSTVTRRLEEETVAIREEIRLLREAIDARAARQTRRRR